MKKLTFFTMIFFSVGCLVNAQTPHTLQFSKAILVSSQQQVPSVGNGDGYDAVWKVIALLPTTGPISNSTNYYTSPAVGSYSITVNSNPISFSEAQGYSSTNGNFSYTNLRGGGNLPMWLPGGTTLAAGNNIQYISVLEFIVN